MSQNYYHTESNNHVDMGGITQLQAANGFPQAYAAKLAIEASYVVFLPLPPQACALGHAVLRGHSQKLFNQ